MLTFGGIGCGNMGGAILNGIGNLKEFNVLGFDLNQETLLSLNASCGLISCEDEIEIAKKSDLILIAVKPFLVEKIVKKIASVLTKDQVIISLAAGVSVERIQRYSNNICPVVVIMPNTPAMVGKGCCALCFDDLTLPEEKKQIITDMFSAICTTVIMPESQICEFSALIGSGPAFVFHMLESMVEAGLRLGFTYEDSKKLVEKLFEGSVKLAQESPEIPHAKLRMNVCSPRGSSIVGVNSLDRTAVRGAIIDSVLATYNRAIEMSSEK